MAFKVAHSAHRSADPSRAIDPLPSPSRSNCLADRIFAASGHCIFWPLPVAQRGLVINPTPLPQNPSLSLPLPLPPRPLPRLPIPSPRTAPRPQKSTTHHHHPHAPQNPRLSDRCASLASGRRTLRGLRIRILPLRRPRRAPSRGCYIFFNVLSVAGVLRRVATSRSACGVTSRRA